MEPRVFLVRSTCRSCESSDLEPIFSLGRLPLASMLVSPAQLEDAEASYPLDLVLCRRCSLVQAMQTVPSSVLYDEGYRTFSSSLAGAVERARSLAVTLIRERQLNGDSFVVEIGSNDGYLLRHFQDRRVPVLGIDPASGPAQVARRCGIPTLPSAFTRSLAVHLRGEGRQADLIVGSHVLNRVADLHGFLAGVQLLLKEDGLAFIEVPYVRDLVDAAQFDAVHHEHLCYFSLTSLAALLQSEGLCVQHVERRHEGEGTLRCYVGAQPGESDTVKSLLAEEEALGMHRGVFYADLTRCAEAVKLRLLSLLGELKAAGSHIVGYGATANNTTLLNYCGIGGSFLDYVVDSNVHKQGRFIPGVQLAILPAERLVSNRPDYALLLAWDARDEILDQQETYRRMGGRFIVPLPEPAIV